MERQRLLFCVELTNSVFTKVMHCNSAKEIWDKLDNIYEGDEKVKRTKLQVYRGQFEILRMEEDDSIAIYFLWVDEIVNTIKGLGEKIEESSIVDKVLRMPPIIFDTKVSTLEERKDLETITMDELHGILTTYEMRTKIDHPPKKEATFKPSKK